MAAAALAKPRRRGLQAAPQRSWHAASRNRSAGLPDQALPGLPSAPSPPRKSRWGPQATPQASPSDISTSQGPVLQQPLPAAWLSKPSPFQPNIQQGNYLQMPLPMEELPSALSSPLRQPSFGQGSSTPSDAPLRGNQAQSPFALPLQNSPVPAQQGQQPQHSLAADAVPGTASHVHSHYSLTHTPLQTFTRLSTDFTPPMTPQPAQSAEPCDYG